MATKKTKTSELDAAASLENLWVFATDNENRSVKASITLLKGNKGDKGDTGNPGNPGTAGKSPRVNGSTGMWEVWDNNTSAWVSTGVDASSGYTLTEEAVRTVLGSAYAPVNEIRYSTKQAGNIFGDKYLPCDGSHVLKTDYPDLLCEDARTLDKISMIYDGGYYPNYGRPLITAQNEILAIDLTGDYWICKFDLGTKAWNRIMQIPDIDTDTDLPNSFFSNLAYNNLTGSYVFFKIKSGGTTDNIAVYLYTTDLETISTGVVNDVNFNINPGHSVEIVCCNYFYLVINFASLYYSEDLESFTRIELNGIGIGAKISFVNNRVVICGQNGDIYATETIANAGMPAFTLKLGNWFDNSGITRSSLIYPTKCFFLKGKYIVMGTNRYNTAMTHFFVTADFEEWIFGGNFQWVVGGGQDKKVFVHNDEFYVWNNNTQIVYPSPPDYNYQTTINLEKNPSNISRFPGVSGEIIYIDGKLYTIYGTVSLIESNFLILPSIENA